MTKKNKLTYSQHFIAVIGKPLVTLEEIGLDCCPKSTIHTNERFLPKILVDLGVFSSTSEVRKNRKELVKTLEKVEWITLKFGHRVLDIIVGQ